MNGFFPNIVRRTAFLYYTVKPFRFSMVARHAHRRLLSAMGIRRGFRVIDLALTYDCNLACGHCSSLKLRSDRPMMTMAEYREIVRQSDGLDNLSWNITGGEPLMDDRLEELIPVLDPKRHYISIQTNCLILTPENARRLAGLGVNCITTSLDSAVEDEHNRIRGGWPDSYRKVLEGVRIARQAGMQVLVGGVVTHDSLRSGELVDLIRNVNRAGAMFLFNLAVPCGNWQGNRDIVIRGDDRKILNDLLRKYPLTTTDHEVGRNAKGCPAGMEKIYITPYGDVLPCPFIHITFGNARNEPLPAIVARMRTIPEFNRYQDICIAAEDTAFHERVFSRIDGNGNTAFPVSWKDIYGVP